MIRTLSAALLLCASTAFAAPSTQAARVTIVRDDLGIAHVHGRSDADAVFGMVYAQAEDDFNRVESNFISALGRTAEVEGEGAIWADLRMRLFIDPVDLEAQYRRSPAWLKALMVAWADGLNYYLATHPTVTPKLIRHFEPWMALSFSEGSIGGDIERVSLAGIEAFYGGKPVALAAADDRRTYREPRGSNGIAIAPKNTAGGRALLLINPHTSFFFRSELQMTSDAGLNAYGAATWGQFFIYQGFNARAGWMHTSSGVDNIDEFAETIVRRDGRVSYAYGSAQRPLVAKTIVVPYRGADGATRRRSFVTYRSHHGPIVRSEGAKWVAVGLMNTPGAALEQSFLRTKASDYASFVRVAGDHRANSSNDTIFADAKGEIAYLHPQFVPVRDDRFDYTKPVDGSDPATDWKGLTPLDKLPRLLDPATGWLFNVNDSPWNAAGASSPRAADFPRYMDSNGSNPRTAHATMLLDGHTGFTPEKLIAAAYDPFLPAFDRLIPALAAAYYAAPDAALAAPLALLQGWDRRWAEGSTATSLGVIWAETLWATVKASRTPDEEVTVDTLIATSGPQKLAALGEAVARMQRDFGSWQTPWGQINRYQRLTGAIVQTFDDAAPSVGIPFASAQWGSLASFGAKPYPGTKKYYGTSGNSFVAVVEFGPRVRAWAVTAGGESGDPASPHFADQVARYRSGALREVLFYPDQLDGRTARTYHPGK